MLCLWKARHMSLECPKKRNTRTKGAHIFEEQHKEMDTKMEAKVV